MKTFIYSCLFLSMTFTCHAERLLDEEKKKVIEKSFKVNPDTELDIDNQFGKIEIDNWDKNEFYVKVEIISEGRTESRAQAILDAIDIDIASTENQVSFETEVRNLKNKNEEGFKINYYVKMPEINALTIKNKFGDVYMGDRSGMLDLDVSYGSFRTGYVKAKGEIKLSFGNGSMDRLDKGNITVKYSDFNLDEGDRIEVEQGYSDIEIGEVNELELESKYGDIEIDKASIIDADIHYSGFEIEELTGSLEMECSYLGDFSIERLAKSFTLLDIDGKFSSYDIGLEPGLQANIEAEFSYSDMKVYSDVDVDFSHRIKETGKSYYKGKIGGGHDTKSIRIDSSYGGAKLKYD